jgi:hypothetical protein
VRNISVALTERQILDESKDVTRRLGWTDLKPGTLLQPVRKGQGLKKGEQVHKVGGPIKVVSVRRESLAKIVILPTYGRSEVKREGFPHLTRTQFVQFFARSHKCEEDAQVTRIEFKHGGFCVGCGFDIEGTARGLCGECACEDDGL